MSYFRYLCLFSYNGVEHILCCFRFVFLRLLYPMLPVSPSCPFFIAPSFSLKGLFIAQSSFQTKDDDKHTYF
jgi:hypothetical protein